MCLENAGRRKSPQQKKQEEYDKDMRPRIEAPHAFRQNWPKKKARINRLKRRRIQAIVRTTMVKGDMDDASPELLKTVEPLQQIKKMEIISLREDVEAKLKWRQML